MNAEEPVQAVEQNDQTIVATTLPEQAKQMPFSMFPTVSITSLIYQWQPMGYRIKIKMPYISDDSSFMFIIRNGPYIPAWYHREERLVPFVFHWNNTRPVFHHRPGGSTNVPGDVNPPLIPTGIEITQHDLPPIISTLAASFRKWRGDMQYRLRVVAGFTTQGYLVTMPIKNAHIPIGIYDEYSRCPPFLRLDTSYREGMCNAYVPSDTSMFRHIEVTMPYEYPMPWYDQYHWLEQRTEVTETLREGVKGTKLVVEPCGDNFIAVGCRGGIDTTKDITFMAVELEYRCMEGFQFADPGLPPYGMLDSTQTYRFNNWDADKAWIRAKTVPDKTWRSDGYYDIRKASNQNQDSYVSRLASLVSTSTLSPIKDHGAQPKVKPEKDPIYVACNFDPRTQSTYCQTPDGKWTQFRGDKRNEMKKYISIKRTERDGVYDGEDLIPVPVRELEFA